MPTKTSVKKTKNPLIKPKVYKPLVSSLSKKQLKKRLKNLHWTIY